eukprot:CAMPEP_0177777744 /NCGR_PEP_ID=MMETSP0491_2-20121128/15553_1 /TAXON_ID=63592 /ORGANISM="Tetraselmis chuii, Strain PLY429" /LENGTH=210 /DNA_ID=CAMNT_0019296909 /DNA_START=171 /DNA_END=803 /DNA_ORIENTATION=+
MSRRVFVGNLPQDIRERELEDIFYKYGRIMEIDLKLPPRPPGFAFVEFEDPRDAIAAVQGRDGYDFYGSRLRVELAKGGSSSGARGGGGFGGYGGPPPRGAPRGGGADRGYGAAPPANAEFRVLVHGLPNTASWQDLKDHMRKAGDVSFAQTWQPGRRESACRFSQLALYSFSCAWMWDDFWTARRAGAGAVVILGVSESDGRLTVNKRS